MAANPAQAIALALRDFVNERPAKSESVDPFLEKIGGVSTLFALVVAIEDNLQRSIVQRCLERLFDDSEAGRARLLQPEVTFALLSGMQANQPKHVRLVSLQQSHLFIKFKQGQQRLLQDDIFNALLHLLTDDDVEITEEVVRLLRKLGATYEGATKFLAPQTLASLFQVIFPADRKLTLVNVAATDAGVMAPLMNILRPSSPESDIRASMDTILLLRTMSLLTQIACGTKLPSDQQGPKLFIDADHSPQQIVEESWNLFNRYGLFHLLLEISSIAPDDPAHDLLVQLNGLELVEEVVTNSPKLNDEFAVRLTKDILDRSAPRIEEAAKESTDSSSSAVIPTASFITVAVLRVFNRLAEVSHEKNIHSWYHEPSLLLFLSASFNNYDDESVQTEAINLLASLSSFPEGLRFFSTVASSLPASVAPSKSAAYLSNAFASSVTPIMLYELAYFVYGTTYSNGLRQLAALHGFAKMFSSKLLFDSLPTADAAAASSSSVASSSPSTSNLLAKVFSYLLEYNPRQGSGCHVLLNLVKQPFEDVREAVWKVVLGLTHHSWGVSAMASTGGFVEYLLDRKTEFHISGIQAKFDILRSLALSPYINHLHDASQKQVKEYVRQGAHFAPLSVGVMEPVTGAR